MPCREQARKSNEPNRVPHKMGRYEKSNGKETVKVSDMGAITTSPQIFLDFSSICKYLLTVSEYLPSIRM
jgi:hypothetical protein